MLMSIHPLLGAACCSGWILLCLGAWTTSVAGWPVLTQDCHLFFLRLPIYAILILHHVALTISTNKGRKLILPELGIQWKGYALVSVHQRKSSIGFLWPQGLRSMRPQEISIHLLVHWAHSRYSSYWEASMTEKHQSLLNPETHSYSLPDDPSHVHRLLRILHHLETFRIGPFPSP